MRHPRRTVRLLTAVALIGITGCVSLGRDSPALEQYVLGSGRTASPAASPDPSGIRVGVRRLDLAAYLNTPAILVRQGANRILASDFHRWGEPLAEGINRAVAQHLAADGAIGLVDIAPWAAGSRHDYLVQLHVSRFEGTADTLATEGAARIVAAWDVIRPSDGAVLARGTTDYGRGSWQVNDFAALVVMLDEGLHALSADLVACLRRVHTSAAPAVANGVPVPQALACGTGG